MNNKKSCLNHAIKAALCAAGIAISTQAQALSLIEPAMPEADQAFPIVDEVFSSADADGNQQLSVEEFYRLHAAAAILEYEMTFKRMDSDGSGDVNAEEFMRFLPVDRNENLKTQFFTAAGEDELLDIKEFSLMRMQAQDNSNNLLWKFATIDHNHDGELTPTEFYGLPFIEPPLILPPPEVTEPPVIIDPPIIIEPLPPEIIIESIEAQSGPAPEIVIEPIEPVIQPIDPEPEIVIEPPVVPEPEAEPEATEEESAENEDTGDQTSPVEANPELLEKIDGLSKKLAALEKRMVRVEKSIARTKEKMAMANDDRKASRLERRLKRQSERLNGFMNDYQETMRQLEEAKKILAG